MSQEEREKTLSELNVLLSKPGGKQAARYLLNSAGSIPIAGGLFAAAGSVWAEREQQAVNQRIAGWVNEADENLNMLNSAMSTALLKPTKSSLALLLGEIIGDELANTLLAGEIESVSVMLNATTINELDPYVACGLLTLQGTGSTMNMGTSNSIGGHVEELKRRHGTGNGYTLSIAT